MTQDQVQQHCRADSSDDPLLALYLSAAADAAQQFLNRRIYDDDDALATAIEALPEVPVNPLAEDEIRFGIVANDSIRAAVLLMAGHLYRTREAVQGTSDAHIEVPLGVHSLLWPYRRGIGI